MNAPGRLDSFWFYCGQNHCGTLVRGGSFLQRGFPMPHLLGDPFARLAKFSPTRRERMKS